MDASSVVVDASALIAYFTASHLHHDAAVESLATAAREQHRRRIHPITLAESLVERATVADHVAHAARIRNLGITTIEFDADAPFRLAELRATTRLRMPDCCVIDAARQHGAAVLSFDDRLRAIASDLGIAIVPPSIAEV